MVGCSHLLGYSHLGDVIRPEYGCSILILETHTETAHSRQLSEHDSSCLYRACSLLIFKFKGSLSSCRKQDAFLYVRSSKCVICKIKLSNN